MLLLDVKDGLCVLPEVAEGGLGLPRVEELGLCVVPEVADGRLGLPDIVKLGLCAVTYKSDWT